MCSNCQTKTSVADLLLLNNLQNKTKEQKNLEIGDNEDGDAEDVKSRKTWKTVQFPPTRFH